MNGILLALAVWFGPFIILEIISIIYNIRFAKTIGELFIPIVFVDEYYRELILFLTFIPVISVLVWIVVIIVVVCMYIITLIAESSAAKWFIKNIWNHKIR